MFEAFFVPSVLTILLIMSIIDFKTRSVKVSLILVLWVFTGLYAVLSFHSWVSLVSLVYLVVIFGPLMLFGFGAGDFVVMSGLWPFFVPLEALWVYIVVFMGIWLCVVLGVYCKEKKGMSIKEFLFKQSIPLIPVITLAFFVYCFISL